MKRLLASMGLVLCLAMSPAQTRAKNRTPSAEEARRIVRDYAACIVKRAHDKASDVLLLNANTSTIKHDFRRLIEASCLRSGVESIGFDADFFRYALANALVSAEFADGGPTDFSDRGLLAHLQPPVKADLDAALAKAKSPKQRDEALSRFRAAEVVASLSRYGECVVRSDPTGVRLWVLSEPASKEEDTRINALRRSFGGCLKDGEVAFSRETLRGTAALNYYRLAHAPAQPSTARVN